eukprot:Gb_09661 [translate_table: standard]
MVFNERSMSNALTLLSSTSTATAISPVFEQGAMSVLQHSTVTPPHSFHPQFLQGVTSHLQQSLNASISSNIRDATVLEPHVRAVDEGFNEARLITEVSLLPERVRIAAGRRAVAMATGFVDRVRKHGEIRKQVLVVVTAGWSIMCFDHNLKKLWEADVQEDFPHGAHHREIAISISNYTLKHGDAGLVIVGGSMEVQPHVLLTILIS